MVKQCLNKVVSSEGQDQEPFDSSVVFVYLCFWLLQLTPCLSAVSVAFHVQLP